MVKVPSNHCCTLLNKYKLVNAIFHVLLLHDGPTTLEFNGLVGNLRMDSEFAQIISYLAKGNKPKELFFENVEVSAQMLKQFLSKCPLLEYLCLVGCQKVLDFVAGENKFTFGDLLQCVPLIQTLDISKYYMKVVFRFKDYIWCKNMVFAKSHFGIWLKYLCAGGMPHKLPTSLVHLKNLFFGCVFGGTKRDLCSALYDNELPVMFDNDKLPVQQTPTNFLDPEEYPDMNLGYLETLKIENFSKLPLEMEFVKLIMAKSPELEEVRIKLNVNVSVDEELKMLREMLLFSFPRASPNAKLIIDRP
ncbi:putative FBD domain-containing protein [Helianthus annuus]|nr:putative FBD domain-containing protein [Helianthus annuus]